MTLDLTTQGFSLANARICALACADSYLEGAASSAPKPSHGCDRALPSKDSFITDTSTDTHVLVRDLGDALIIAFRGSASLRNWLTDLDAMKKAIALSHVHAGFLFAFDSVVLQIQSAINAKLQHADTPVAVFFTGHSLGGALAAIAGVEFASNYWPVGRVTPCAPTTAIVGVQAPACPSSLKAGLQPPLSPFAPVKNPIIHSVYTFGQPRVGDAQFARDASRCGMGGPSATTFRVTNRADIVPWVPGWLMGYRHFGQHIHFDALGMHVNPLPLQQLAVNGLEIWREFRRGDAALLTDHAIAKYQEALG